MARFSGSAALNYATAFPDEVEAAISDNAVYESDGSIANAAGNSRVYRTATSNESPG